MIGRRAIVGLCMLCALAFSAFAAQGASAKGTTMFTCVEDAAGGLDSHCANAGSGFKHVAVAEETTTHLKIVNTSAQKFKSTIAGTAFTLESNALVGTGSVKNRLDPEGEHWIHGTGVKLVYTGVTTSVPKCGVSGLPGGAGKVETDALTTTTTAKGESLVLTPEGTKFAEFEFTGAECPLKAVKVKVVGSITCKPKGATLECDHEETTAAKTLRLGSATGTVAGYDGDSTITGADKPEETTKPLSVTTVATP